MQTLNAEIRQMKTKNKITEKGFQQVTEAQVQLSTGCIHYLRSKK